MRYQMQHKWFTLGRNYTIADENGTPRFQVQSRVLSLGRHLTFSDLDGNELATLQQKIIAFLPTYEITREHTGAGAEQAEVKKRLSIFGEKFSVDIPGPHDYEVRGNIWNHEYAFTRDGQQVAQVSKQWFSLKDVYGVDIIPGEDDILILAATVVIDLINEDAEHRG
jgi:uncharacterized protein YxjI